MIEHLSSTLLPSPRLLPNFFLFLIFQILFAKKASKNFTQCLVTRESGSELVL